MINFNEWNKKRMKIYKRECYSQFLGDLNHQNLVCCYQTLVGPLLLLDLVVLCMSSIKPLSKLVALLWFLGQQGKKLYIRLFIPTSMFPCSQISFKFDCKRMLNRSLCIASPAIIALCLLLITSKSNVFNSLLIFFILLFDFVGTNLHKHYNEMLYEIS